MEDKKATLGFDKIYVINLKKRADRRAKLLERFPNLELTFIEAVDAKELNKDQLIQQGLLNTRFEDPSGMVTMGVFACALSHKKAWDQALKDNIDTCLVLEDDVLCIIELIQEEKLSSEYKDILQDMNNLDWDLIHLGKKTEFQSGINISKYFVVPRYNTNFHGAHAYVIKKDTAKFLSDNYLPVKYAADVYIEQLCSTHNVFTLRKSLFRQDSDLIDGALADSDTYYNDYREGGGKVGISFDEKGNVLNKELVQYVQHPKDMIEGYVISVLGRPKFGDQVFKYPNSLFGISSMLSSIRLGMMDFFKYPRMLEVRSHCGENTFFFGCSNLFSHIYVVDPLKGEDSFNVKNDMTWEDVKLGFHTNTYFFEDSITYINDDVENIENLFEDRDFHFIYINVRNESDFEEDVQTCLPKLEMYSFLGGSHYNKVSKILKKLFKQEVACFEDGSWLLRVEK